MRLDLDSGRVDTVFQTGARIPAMDPALAVSPDGKWLLIGQVDMSFPFGAADDLREVKTFDVRPWTFDES